MATYVIGDVQGCFDELQVLLRRISFEPAHDRLWFCGDLVNRGPRSLAVLRFVYGLGNRAIVVLGNHDLHLLAVAYGQSPQKRKDSFDDVLKAEDKSLLIEWLRHRPLLHYDSILNVLLVHAGLPPQWDLAKARLCADEVQRVLTGPGHIEYFRNMYGNQPTYWSDDLQGWARIRFITNCLTRLRYCDSEGQLALKYKGALGTQGKGRMPWFQVPGRATLGTPIAFGHWSTLGDYEGHDVYALDTGCVWGGKMTALRLEDRQRFAVTCRQACVPG